MNENKDDESEKFVGFFRSFVVSSGLESMAIIGNNNYNICIITVTVIVIDNDGESRKENSPS